MTDTKHTPTPYTARKSPFAIARGEDAPCIEIAGPDGHAICEVRLRRDRTAAEATAAFIVHACNNIKRVEAALRAAHDYLDRDPRLRDDGDEAVVMDKIRDALAKAQEPPK